MHLIQRMKIWKELRRLEQRAREAPAPNTFVDLGQVYINLDMHDKARVTAENCAIYSNSRSPSSLRLHSAARVKADLVCVAGGVTGSKASVSPNAPIEDCPPLADPLRDRPEPSTVMPSSFSTSSDSAACSPVRAKT